MEDTSTDTEIRIWTKSYAGQVYDAIKRLHQDPKSFINLIERVYIDLLPQILGIATTMDTMKGLLRAAVRDRPWPQENPKQTL